MKLLIFFLIAIFFGSVFCSDETELNCDEDDGDCHDEPELAKPQPIRSFSSVFHKSIEAIKTKDLHYDSLLFGGVILLFLVYVCGSVLNNRHKKKFNSNLSKLIHTDNVLNINVSNDESLVHVDCKDSTDIEGLMLRIQLIKRHNLIEFLKDIYNLEISEILTFTIKPKSNKKMIFAIVKKEKANQIRRKRTDINIFTKQYTIKGLDKYVVLSEHIDLNKLVIDETMLNLIKELENTFIAFIYSDQPIKYPSKTPVESCGIIDIEYKFEKFNQNIKNLNNYIINKINNFKIPSEVEKKTVKNRVVMYAPIDQKIKEEKERINRERNNNNNNQVVDKEQQKKREERAKRKKAKKQGTKIMTKS